MILGLGGYDSYAKIRDHAFYVSVCQIDFNTKTARLEIAIKTFTDDFERALEEVSKKRLHLGTSREFNGTFEIIKKYLEDHFEIQLNDSPVDLIYLGKEVEIDVTWCYIESTRISLPNDHSNSQPVTQLPTGKIKVTNRILFETFENQSNIVHIRIGEHQKSLLLSGSSESESVTF